MSLPFEDLEDDGSHVFASVSARSRAVFKWLEPHSVEGDPQVALSWPAGARYPIARSHSSHVQSFTVNAVTRGSETQKLLALLESGYPLGLIHSDKACQAEDCDIPRTQVVQVTGFPRSREDDAAGQRTVWTIDVVPVDKSVIGEIASSGWWDVEQFFSSWFDASEAGSWFDVSEVEQFEID